jgi:hypothetical protein
MLASISYRYLREKYEVISGSPAQAQNGNDARWNSVCVVVRFLVLKTLIRHNEK